MGETIVVFTSIVAIVTIVVVGGIAKAYFRSREAALSARAEEDVAAQFDRLARLEERIEVIERIVTDEKLELKRQLNSL